MTRFVIHVLECPLPRRSRQHLCRRPVCRVQPWGAGVPCAVPMGPACCIHCGPQPGWTAAWGSDGAAWARPCLCARPTLPAALTFLMPVEEASCLREMHLLVLGSLWVHGRVHLWLGRLSGHGQVTAVFVADRGRAAHGVWCGCPQVAGRPRPQGPAGTRRVSHAQCPGDLVPAFMVPWDTTVALPSTSPAPALLRVGPAERSATRVRSPASAWAVQHPRRRTVA